MAEQEPGFDPELVGLRKAIHGALSAHARVDKRGGIHCSGPDCTWTRPPGSKSTTQRFLNHQTFEIQQAVTAWFYGRKESAGVSRETMQVL